jgi:hypothetical protein
VERVHSIFFVIILLLIDNANMPVRRLKLKTPCRDGTEYLVFTPTEFRDGEPMEKLVALIPIPRFHLTGRWWPPLRWGRC